MSEEISHERRRILGTMATAIAAAQFGMISSTIEQRKAGDFAADYEYVIRRS